MKRTASVLIFLVLLALMGGPAAHAAPPTPVPPTPPPPTATPGSTPVPVGTWTEGPSMAAARDQHTATLLQSGKVLVAGGCCDSQGSSLAGAELYDPVAGNWSTGGTMGAARDDHTATLLPSGRVLVTGGSSEISDDGESSLASAELYDPAQQLLGTCGEHRAARSGHSATLLPSGRVLVAGGCCDSQGNALAGAELYDPASNSWAPAASMSAGRVFHTATLLPSGQVLVAGGGNGSYPFPALASAELYDPAGNSWAPAASLAAGRQFHTATLLPSGQVLVAGGADDNADDLASAELYDPAGNSWSAAASLGTGRASHTATLLPSGQVLVAGGDGNTGLATLASAELYDPAGNTWAPAASLNTGRSSHTATLLPSGQVLVVGGWALSDALPDSELFAVEPPAPGGSAGTPAAQ